MEPTAPTDIARAVAREATRLVTVVQAAAEWIDPRTPDGYPPRTSGSGTTSSHEPGHSTVLAAIEHTPTITVEGEPVDLRTVRLFTAAHLTAALHHLRHVAKMIDAVPRQATGHQAVTIDHELRHARCEGWAAQHAICDDNSVKTTVVDGSTLRLCDRCYRAMWRATLPAPDQRGRTVKDPMS